MVIADRRLVLAAAVILLAAVIGYLARGTGGLITALIIGPIVFGLAIPLARRRARKARSA